MQNQQIIINPQDLNMFRTDEDYPSWIIARSVDEAVDLYISECGEECYRELLEESDAASEDDFKRGWMQELERDWNFTLTDEDGGSETNTVDGFIKQRIDEGVSFPHLFAVTGN